MVTQLWAVQRERSASSRPTTTTTGGGWPTGRSLGQSGEAGILYGAENQASWPQIEHLPLPEPRADLHQAAPLRTHQRHRPGWVLDGVHDRDELEPVLAFRWAREHPIVIRRRRISRRARGKAQRDGQTHGDASKNSLPRLHRLSFHSTGRIREQGCRNEIHTSGSCERVGLRKRPRFTMVLI